MGVNAGRAQGRSQHLRAVVGWYLGYTRNGVTDLGVSLKLCVLRRYNLGEEELVSTMFFNITYGVCEEVLQEMKGIGHVRRGTNI